MFILHLLDIAISQISENLNNVNIINNDNNNSNNNDNDSNTINNSNNNNKYNNRKFQINTIKKFLNENYNQLNSLKYKIIYYIYLILFNFFYNKYIIL